MFYLVLTPPDGKAAPIRDKHGVFLCFANQHIATSRAEAETMVRKCKVEVVYKTLLEALRAA